jgi:hypothetical protein
MKIRAFIYFVFFMVSLASCTDSFVPDVEKFDELLVVDGAITDAPGPYTIRLSVSSKPMQLSKFNPYPGCKVVIEDNVGNKAALIEQAPGVYRTIAAAIHGVVGRTYKLTISTPEGETYESTPEPILKGSAIRSVYGELVHKNNPNVFDGYQFYVDAETPEGKDKYLFWQVESTYKFQSDYQVYGIYDNGLHPVADPNIVRNCYRTVKIGNLYLLNPNEQIASELKHVQLNYEGNSSKALLIRYSLNVTQLTIDKRAFTYWSEIKKMQDAGGELYTQQPYQVKNNLTNLSNPDRPALGYFMAASASEKRIFLNRPPIAFQLDTCLPNEIKRVCDDQCLFDFLQRKPNLWPVFVAKLPNSNVPKWVAPECVDCRERGFQAKPPFWVD